MQVQPKSLQTKIVLFLFIGLGISFLITTFAVSKYIYLLQKSELKDDLRAVSKDILRHELYLKPEVEILKELHFTEQKKEISKLCDIHIVIDTIVPNEQEDRFFVSEKIDLKNYLIVSSSTKKIDSEVNRIVKGVLLLVSIIMVFFTIFFTLFIYNLLLPMKRLVQSCSEFSKNRVIQLPKGGSLEIEELRNAIEKLLKQNMALCSKERDIFKEAAHELKTPVAILKSRLALFNKKESFTKEKFVQEANEDINLIVIRLRELLFLKTVEMDMHGQNKSIDIVSQCTALQSAFKPLVDKKRLNMIPIRKGTFILFSNENALQKVLLAVFENIFIHSKNNSTITVIVDGDKRLLEIQNEIALENDDKLFSSQIGTKIIERLSEILNYTYSSHTENEIFFTRIYFKEV